MCGAERWLMRCSLIFRSRATSGWRTGAFSHGFPFGTMQNLFRTFARSTAPKHRHTFAWWQRAAAIRRTQQSTVTACAQRRWDNVLEYIVDASMHRYVENEVKRKTSCAPYCSIRSFVSIVNVAGERNLFLYFFSLHRRWHSVGENAILITLFQYRNWARHNLFTQCILTPSPNWILLFWIMEKFTFFFSFAFVRSPDNKWTQ